VVHSAIGPEVAELHQVLQIFDPDAAPWARLAADERLCARRPSRLDLSGAALALQQVPGLVPCRPRRPFGAGRRPGQRPAALLGLTRLSESETPLFLDPRLGPRKARPYLSDSMKAFHTLRTEPQVRGYEGHSL